MDVYRLLERRALVSRGAARTIVAALKSQTSRHSQTLELDFSGIDAVTPSFVDELLSGLSARDFAGYERLRFIRPPSRLSEKFQAIGRARGLQMEETPDGEWVIQLPLVNIVD
jgi:hypothetical protein